MSRFGRVHSRGEIRNLLSDSMVTRASPIKLRSSRSSGLRRFPSFKSISPSRNQSSFYSTRNDSSPINFTRNDASPMNLNASYIEQATQARFALQRQWANSAIPMYYQNLFSESVKNLGHVQGTIAMRNETERLERGTSSIQRWIKLVSLRERAIASLQAWDGKNWQDMEVGFAEYQKLLELNVNVANAITRWRNELVNMQENNPVKQFPVFRYKYENYLLKMHNDLQFLQSSQFDQITSQMIDRNLSRRISKVDLALTAERSASEKRLTQNQKVSRSLTKLVTIKNFANPPVDPKFLLAKQQAERKIKQQIYSKLLSSMLREVWVDIACDLAEGQLWEMFSKDIIDESWGEVAATMQADAPEPKKLSPKQQARLEISEDLIDTLLNQVAVEARQDEIVSQDVLESFLTAMITDVTFDSIQTVARQKEIDEINASKLSQIYWNKEADRFLERLVKHQVKEHEVALATFDSMLENILDADLKPFLDQNLKEERSTRHDIAEWIMETYISQVVYQFLVCVVVPEAKLDVQMEQMAAEIGSQKFAKSDWYQTNINYQTIFSPVNLYDAVILSAYERYLVRVPKILQESSLNPEQLWELSKQLMNVSWFWITEDNGKIFGLVVIGQEFQENGTRQHILIHFSTISMDVFSSTAEHVLKHVKRSKLCAKLRMYIYPGTGTSSKKNAQYVKYMLSQAGINYKATKQLGSLGPAELLGVDWPEWGHHVHPHFSVSAQCIVTLSNARPESQEGDDICSAGASLNTWCLLIALSDKNWSRAPENQTQADIEDLDHRISQIPEFQFSGFKIVSRQSPYVTKLKIPGKYPVGNQVSYKNSTYLQIFRPHFYCGKSQLSSEIIYMIPTFKPNREAFFIPSPPEPFGDVFSYATKFLRQVQWQAADKWPGQIWIPSFGGKADGHQSDLAGYSVKEDTFVNSCYNEFRCKQTIDQPIWGQLKTFKSSTIIRPPFIFGILDKTVYEQLEIPMFVIYIANR